MATPSIMRKGTSSPMQGIPLYDDGGDVQVDPEKDKETPDVNDGQHQLAVLKDGEKVLTPEESVAYKAGQQSTSQQNPGPETSAPEQKEPTDLTAGVDKMFAGEQPKDQTQVPMRPEEPKTALGSAMGSQESGPPKLAQGPLNPKLEPLPPPDPNQQQPAPEPLHPDTHALLKTHEAMLAKEYQDKLSKGDLLGAGTAKLAKLELEKAHPWGSEDNHPGALGKIAHVASRIGNIAGDLLVPKVMAQIPGTDLNRGLQAGQARGDIKEGLGENLTKADTAEKEALAKNAGVGKTINERTYQDLLHGGPDGGPKVNPDTNTPYDSQTALIASQGTGKGVEEEDVQELMKTINPDTGKPYTRIEADERVRAGVKPANPKLQELTDYMKAKGLADTPANRDLARVQLEKRDTEAKAEAGLPAAEQKIRLQAQLQAANQDLNANHANSLQRGDKADEFTQKENARHNLRVTQIVSAQNALESSDSNMLAASIVPILATMTESNAQGIKRLNPQELARFMPKSSGDAKQWFEAHYDQLSAGQIPQNYRADLRELLNNLAREEDGQYKANTGSIDQTLGKGAAVPNVTTTGKTQGATPRKPGAPKVEAPAGATNEVYKSATDHTVIGHMVNGKYEPLKQ